MPTEFTVTIQKPTPFFSASVSVTVPDGASVLEVLDLAKAAFVTAQGLKVTPPTPAPVVPTA